MPITVKPIVWERFEGKFLTQTVWCPSEKAWPCWIVHNDEGPSSKYVWCENIGIDFVPSSEVMGAFDSLEEAQAAAEEDYRKRVLALVEETLP